MPAFSVTPAKAAKDPNVSHAQFRLLSLLGIYADSETRWCYPSIGALAKDLGTNERTVKRHMSALVHMGYVNRLDRGRTKVGMTQVRFDFEPNIKDLEGGVTEGHYNDEVVSLNDTRGSVTEGHPERPTFNETPPSPTERPPKGGNSRQGRKVSWPDGFFLDEAMAAYAEECTPGVDAEADFEKFENNHRSKGNKFVDWKRAWQTWCRSEFAKPMKNRANGNRHGQRNDCRNETVSETALRVYRNLYGDDHGGSHPPMDENPPFDGPGEVQGRDFHVVDEGFGDLQPPSGSSNARPAIEDRRMVAVVR